MKLKKVVAVILSLALIGSIGVYSDYEVSASEVASESTEPTEVENDEEALQDEEALPEEGLENTVEDDSSVGTSTASIATTSNDSVAVSSIESGAASISYSAHVQNIGWKVTAEDGESCGTTGQSLRVEAIKIGIDSTYSGGVSYRTYAFEKGWLSDTTDNNISGTTGESRVLEAIEISLTGDVANYYDVYYRVHVSSFGWLDWAKNGDTAGTIGYGKKIEDVQIVLVEKGGEAPGSTTTPSKETTSIYYNSHVQYKGWLSYVSNGTSNGTTGQSLRMEALQIFIESEYEGGISASAHVQNIGWMSEVGEGEVIGTSGKSLRVEAITLELTGDIANYYDIYYRVHVQNFGWLDWAKNGEAAGSAGYSYRAEAMQIVLVEKGGAAPGSTTTPYVDQMDNIPGWSRGVSTKSVSDKTGTVIDSDAKFIVDVSQWQGTVNWSSVISKNCIDGVILRCSSGGQSSFKDSKFDYNVASLNSLGVSYGIYHRSNATTEAEAATEAAKAVAIIKAAGAKPTMPVYIDIEDHGGSADLVAIAKVFCDAFEAAGYTAGIYANQWYWSSFLNDDSLDKYTKWIAYYGLNDTYPSSTWRPDSEYDMWQYTSKGVLEGITYNTVDFNIMF